MGNHSTLLMDEAPLQVLPQLAVAIGLNEALVLQQIYCWIQEDGQKRDGKYGTKKSITDIQKSFPFFSFSTIQRIIYSLEEQKLLQSTPPLPGERNRKNWRTINYDRLQHIGLPILTMAS